MLARILRSESHVIQALGHFVDVVRDGTSAVDDVQFGLAPTGGRRIAHEREWFAGNGSRYVRQLRRVTRAKRNQLVILSTFSLEPVTRSQTVLCGPVVVRMWLHLIISVWKKRNSPKIQTSWENHFHTEEANHVRRKRKSVNEKFHLDGVRVENETGERTSLDVLVLVSDGDFPLARLVRLECGRVDTVIVDDRAVEDPIGWRLGLHRQGTSSGSVRIDLKFSTKNILVF